MGIGAGAMAAISIGMTVVGTMASMQAQQQAADAAKAQGEAQQQAANYQANSLDVQAGQERASAQRQAIEKQRQEGIVLSRSQALAAASGGGASDPTVISNDSKIVREGELGALNALYSGDQSAQNMENAADLARFTGAASATGANARAGAMQTASYGTALSGLGSATSLYSKYGMGFGGGGDYGAFGAGQSQIGPAMTNMNTGIGAVPY